MPPAALARPAEAVPGGGCAPRRHWFDLPKLSPAGGVPPAALACLCLSDARGGFVFFLACLPRLWFDFLPPIPPTPFPGGEGGDYRLILPGAPPPAPRALNRLRHLQPLPCRHPAHGRLWFGAEPTEVLSSEQCRQPRRGGTGGEELRRLRWSSPPGQGEQVPLGFSPLRTPQWQGQPATSRASPPKITPAPAARGKP